MWRQRGILAFTGVLTFCLLAFCLPPVYSASITERDARLIEIAYMNGFVAALQLDEKATATLRKNKQLLRQLVKAKSKEYLDLVRSLNPGGNP